MNDKERLLDWMAQKKMSAKQLAETIGVTPQLISMIKSDDRGITEVFKWRFGEAFGFDVAKSIFVDEPIRQGETVPA